MNSGIFGFPTPLTGSILSITEFDASGTYTIPEEASSIEFLLVGGGGGGGSGRRAAGTPTTVLAGGGGGGSGGGLTHHIVYKNQIKNIRNLIITIGVGGAGALSASGTVNAGANNPGVAGGAGGNSFVTSQENKLFIISASGGLGGNGGTTPNTAAGSAAGGAARNYFISAIPLAMVAGGNGSANSLAGGANGPNLQYNNFRSNGGCGGGSSTSATTSFAGGSISVPDNRYTEPFAINFNYVLGSGLTIVSGGNANLGNIDGAGQDGILAYTNSMGFEFFSGIGGGGGGAANNLGGGNGGNGYRGGGGGGGGGFHSATTTTNRSGNGGKGGNGYCRIIARK